MTAETVDFSKILHARADRFFALQPPPPLFCGWSGLENPIEMGGDPKNSFWPVRKYVPFLGAQK